MIEVKNLSYAYGKKQILNDMSFGIAEEDAIRAASYNPACSLGAQDKIGSIKTGKYADFVVCNGDYSEKTVYMGGKKLA
jgi:N-acetylglucosamine-6-phosphate deacetylase